MVQNAPGIDDVEATQLVEVRPVQYRALLDQPQRIIGKVTALELARAGHRLRIVVEGVHRGA